MADSSSVCRRRAAAQDRLDVGAEADVEHAVGFVEDDVADLVERQGAAAAGGRGRGRACRRRRRTPCVSGGQLLPDALAAVDRRRQRQFGVRRELDGFLGDLDDEFAGRGQDDGLRAGEPSSFRQLLKNGSRNAAVLPVPVWAWPITSRPARASGIKAAWIGVGSV